MSPMGPILELKLTYSAPDTWHTMTHSKCAKCPALRSLPRKACKFSLSRNSTKFNMVPRFRETIPTVKFVSSSEIYKIPNFDQNYHFTFFFRKLDFLGVSHSPPPPPLKKFRLKIPRTYASTTCICNPTQSLLCVQTLTFPSSQSLTIQWAVSLIRVINDIYKPSPCRLTNTRRNFSMGN